MDQHQQSRGGGDPQQRRSRREGRLDPGREWQQIRDHLQPEHRPHRSIDQPHPALPLDRLGATRQAVEQGEPNNVAEGFGQMGERRAGRDCIKPRPAGGQRESGEHQPLCGQPDAGLQPPQNERDEQQGGNRLRRESDPAVQRGAIVNIADMARSVG